MKSATVDNFFKSDTKLTLVADCVWRYLWFVLGGECCHLEDGGDLGRLAVRQLGQDAGHVALYRPCVLCVDLGQQAHQQVVTCNVDVPVSTQTLYTQYTHNTQT